MSGSYRAAPGPALCSTAIRIFAGGVTNSGRISALTGIRFTHDGVFGNAAGSGGISNTGTISAVSDGIALVTRFGVDRRYHLHRRHCQFRHDLGRHADGIDLFHLSAFSPAVFRSAAPALIAGTHWGSWWTTRWCFPAASSIPARCRARPDIGISGSTITGAIIDSGIIAATSHGISIGSGSEIVASGGNRRRHCRQDLYWRHHQFRHHFGPRRDHIHRRLRRDLRRRWRNPRVGRHRDPIRRQRQHADAGSRLHHFGPASIPRVRQQPCSSAARRGRLRSVRRRLRAGHIRASPRWK